MIYKWLFFIILGLVITLSFNASHKKKKLPPKYWYLDQSPVLVSPFTESQLDSIWVITKDN